MGATPNPPKLQPCQDCGHLCSREAISCPNCGRPISRPGGTKAAGLRDEILTQILTQSTLKTTMCLTLLGLVKVAEKISKAVHVADELLALNAVVFVISSALAHMALKEARVERKLRVGKIADRLFTGGMVLLAVICIVLFSEIMHLFRSP